MLKYINVLFNGFNKYILSADIFNKLKNLGTYSI
jgi:hypothetical protein